MSSKYENEPLLYFEHKVSDFKKGTATAIKKGMRRGLNELRDTARLNLKSSVKGATKRNPKYNDTLYRGIRSSNPQKSKYNKSEITGTVKISSTRKTGSGSFRLAILERGTFKTPNRYARTIKGKRLKKPRFTGSLRAYQFFKNAHQRVTPERVQKYITRELDYTIHQLNQK